MVFQELAEFIDAALDILKWGEQTALGDDSRDALDELPGLFSDLKYKLEKLSLAPSPHAVTTALLETVECYELPNGHLTGCTQMDGVCQPHCEKGRAALALARGEA